ncbi:MAG: CocE/NonD family hydrolase [Pirellulaceae bacterium]
MNHSVYATLITLLVGLSSGAVLAAQPAEIVVTKNRMVPMRDGVKLATDIYRPVNDGEAVAEPLPVILIRTPYSKDGKEADGTFFAKHGYVFVAQDVRGRYKSEGAFYIYTSEGPDGYDTVEWIAKQPWCNGKVGTWGSSYQAATQNALAVLKPPHLRTMFVVNGTSNYVEDGAGREGAFALLHNMAYCFRLAATGHEAEKDARVKATMDDAYDKLPQWLWAGPLKRTSPLRWTSSYQQWYADWRAHPTYDRYWKQNGYSFEEHHGRYPEIPICFLGGWYDIFKRGTLRNFKGLAQRKAHTKLIMGPWTHTAGTTDVGDVDFGPKAKLSVEDEALRWFDQFLKGEDKGILKEPPVKYFLMGGGSGERNDAGRLQSGGRWETADQWPPAGFAERRFYLHADGSLHANPAKTGDPSVFQFDPAHPVPTIGGNIDSGKHLVPRGAQNQTPRADHPFSESELPLAARRDVLSFETPPLKQDVEVTGPMRVSLWVSSNALDTDFTAKLIDVHPPSDDFPAGYAMNVEDGILRMRFRNGRDREELMQSGKVYEVTIDLWATANLFRKGHRIRLDVSSSNFPMFDPNPNTGERLGRHTHMKKAINSVYHDAEHPSCLILPVRAER